jgi:hypothetical protein
MWHPGYNVLKTIRFSLTKHFMELEREGCPVLPVQNFCGRNEELL